MVLTQKSPDLEDKPSSISYGTPKMIFKDATRKMSDRRETLKNECIDLGTDTFIQMCNEIVEECEIENEAIEKHCAIINARSAEIRKVYEMPDSKFPELFRADRYRSIAYLKTLDIKAITELLNQIKARPQHWESILAYRTGEALELLESEIARRKTEKHGILDRLKDALTNNKEKEVSHAEHDTTKGRE